MLNPIAIDGLIASDTDIARAACALVEQVHPKALVNHVHRTWLFADEITPALIHDTLALFPRLGFKKAFTESLAEVASKKPYTAVGTGLADIGRRLVTGLEIPDVCELIYSAPFGS